MIDQRFVWTLCAAAGLGQVMAGDTAAASDGLRIAAWNIENYNGGSVLTTRNQNIQTSVYGEFNGRSFAPDVLLLQEISGTTALNNLVATLNAAPGSPGDWVAAPLFDNGSINTCLAYRSSRVILEGQKLVAAGGGPPNHPRNIVRYDMRLAGYDADDARFAFYPTHQKAGDSGSDQDRRRLEAQRIVADLATLPSGWHYVLGGDFNTQGSSQPSFRTLVGTSYNTGPFRDPITAPGTWQNVSAFRMIHTQDPDLQLDDRYDILLISPSLVDSVGAEYIGDFSTPWDLSTWNDPNHSYRCWGNDGTSYNTVITTSGNANVGPQIAAALRASSDHLPVYFDTRVPARTFALTTPIDLGDVNQGEAAAFSTLVGSAGSVSLWGVDGVEVSEFSFDPGPGVDAPVGLFTDAAGGAIPSFDFSFTAATPGPVETWVDVLSNDAGSPVIRIPVAANVLAADPSCNEADLAEPFGTLDIADVVAFLGAFGAGDEAADLAEPIGSFDIADVVAFLGVFGAGCP